MRSFFYIIACIICLCSCSKKKQETPLFELLTADKTGLHFNNHLTATPQFNMFNYMYFYNGAGVAAGDFNNDGKTDLFFCSNQQQNKIFINEGKLTFKDVTSSANIPNDGGWSTGVSVIDINNDGLLDLYVCRVGQYEILKGKNQLLICKEIRNGIPYYEDEAAKYGLDFSGFSTQAAFFDYDLDGDLDMYLMNHSVHHNGTFAPRAKFIGTQHALSGDRFFRNDKGKFVDATDASGINTSAIGYGLGIAIADINVDGWPDIYIGNDFHENDYLYINQKNGTFKDTLTASVMHTSQFSMGVDVADLNNDALPEIVSMDMLPDDPYILKRSLGEDEYETFFMKIRYGYNYQYARNALQFNRGNGMFSETGLYSGVYATDWSWAPLFADFNNDGLKDLFVSNGIPKRLNDIDYVNYVSNDEVQAKINNGQMNEKEMAVIDKFPQIKLPNKFYLNKGNLSFSDKKNRIENNLQTFSNGAVYADLDSDGDLDFVVNNIDDNAMLYRNTINDNANTKYATLALIGNSANRNAIGAKIILFTGNQVSTYEKFPVKGFQSSMETPMHIGFGVKMPDSIFLVWPNNTYQKIDTLSASYQFKTGLPLFDYSYLQKENLNTTPHVENITNKVNLGYLHVENRFNEFNREQLLPHMLSTEGPALAVGDINNDGLDDVFIGSSKGFRPVLFTQNTVGKFQVSLQLQLDADSVYEETGAVIADFNKDGWNDLALASGGNEYYGEDIHQAPRLFLNNGSGLLVKIPDAFPADVLLTASCIEANDVNGDGLPDLFIGARTTVYNYGLPPKSYLLLNKGNGKFEDVTTQYSIELQNAGMVTGAQWADINQDGKTDLLVSTEWGKISAYLFDGKKFTRKNISNENGWWRFVKVSDVDGDGDADIIAGNLGLNSRLKASRDQPVRMYFSDFDGNGKNEQLLTYFVSGKEIPFANKAELDKQMPVLKKKFLYAEDFAKASLNDIFPGKDLNKAIKYEATNFVNTLFINQGNMEFDAVPMPWQAQLSPYNTAAIFSAGNKQQIFLGGNFLQNNIQMGRYDADFGTLLTNNHQGFTASPLNGEIIKGQVSKILPISISGKQAFIVARNNDSTLVLQFHQ